jgi:hypothetical protein
MPVESVQSLSDFIDAIYVRAWPFTISMAAVGVLSMAAIQVLKEILPARRWFQQRFVRRWLAERSGGAGEDAAERDLVRLAASGDRLSFYDLPLEQLCGQMNAAAPLVLDFPARYEGLFRALAHEADPADVDLLLRPPVFPRGAREALPQDQYDALNRFADARNRVTHHVQRSIDALQIAAGGMWRRRMQMLSFVVSFGITFLGLWGFHGGAFEHDLGPALLTAIVGGFVAPVARDLVASVQRLRRS